MQREDALDLRRQAEIEQVGGAEVDRDAEVDAGAALLADLRQRPVEDERRERAGQLALLDEREEVAGAEEAPLRMLPAHQRLDAPHGARPDVGLRLVVQHQLAGLERAVQIADERQPFAAVAVALAAGRPRDRCASASPRTSRRRRAGAARARRANGAGRCAMPTLASMWTRMPPTSNDCSSAERSRSPAALAVVSSPGIRTTANSSPPSRASVSSSRSSELSRGPIWRSTWSPAWWPSVSLSSLNPSRSTSRSASSSLRLGARGHGGVEPVHEVTAVAEPGQIVGLRLVAALAQTLDDGEPGASHSGQHSDDRERDGDVGDLGELPDRQQRERDHREDEERREHHGTELGPRRTPPRRQPCGTTDEHRRNRGRHLARAEGGEPRERHDDGHRRTPP